jgi:hypothetical protein
MFNKGLKVFGTKAAGLEQKNSTSYTEEVFNPVDISTMTQKRESVDALMFLTEKRQIY